MTDSESKSKTPDEEVLDLSNLISKLKDIYSVREDTSNLIDDWINSFCKSHPEDSMIKNVKDNELYSVKSLLEYVQYLYNCTSGNERTLAINRIIELYHHCKINSATEPDELDDVLEPIYVIIQNYIVQKMENVQLRAEIAKLRIDNKQLMDENTELLLRPNGPAAIELGKRFVQMSNSDNEEHKL